MLRRSTASALALAALIGFAGRVHAQVPSPEITGPITSPGSAFLGGTTSIDLGEVGYEQAEYFVAGAASAYVNTAPLGTDGKWSVEPGDTAPHEIHRQSTLIEIPADHIRDFELPTRGRLQLPRNFGDVRIEEIQASDREPGFRMFGFLFDRENAPDFIEFQHAISLGILDVIPEHIGAR